MKLMLMLVMVFECGSQLSSQVAGWSVCPRHCVCVKHKVDCSRVNLRDLPTYLPQYVEELDLSNNDLDYIPSTVGFIPQTLLHLDLSGNRIRNVPDKSLQQLWMLRSLDLSANFIYRASDVSAAVGHAKRLTRLDLSRNPLREIGGEKCPRFDEYDRFRIPNYKGLSVVDESALQSDYISELDLSGCDLTRINQCAFRWLTNLTRLYLSNNPIKQLTRFQSPTLQHLEMNNCGILYVTPNAFEGLPSLKYLDLSRNGNIKLHTPFNMASGGGGGGGAPNGNSYMSKTLMYLDVSYSGINELFVSLFPNLQHCSFKGNIIREVPARAFYLNRALNTIDLSENLISTTGYMSFVGAESLTSLDLSVNFISEFQHATFSHMLSLTCLNVSRNPLKSMSNITSPVLRALDASDCDINDLPASSFFNVPDLVSLNLSNNPLERLPDELRSAKLKELDLKYCRISAIKRTTFENLPSLNRLDLRGNRLTIPFGDEILSSIERVGDLTLSNNPWQCRCNDTKTLNKFLKFVAKRMPVVEDTVSKEEQGEDDGRAEEEEEALSCRKPDSYLEMAWSKACRQPPEIRPSGPEKQWMAFVVTFAVVSSVLIVLFVLRQNLMSEDPASSVHHRTQAAAAVERVPDETVNDPLLTTARPVRSPIADILQLPTYEEAILLPKPPPMIVDDTTGTREVATWISRESSLVGEEELGQIDNEPCPKCKRQSCVCAVSSTSL